MEFDFSTLLIIYFLSLAVGLWIMYEIIKSATKKAIKEEMTFLKAYKLSEMKHSGISSKDINRAFKYLGYLQQAKDIGKYNDKDHMAKIEEWWSKPTPLEGEEKEAQKV